MKLFTVSLFLSSSTNLEHCSHRTKEHYIPQLFLHIDKSGYWTIKHAVIVWSSGYIIVLVFVCAYVVMWYISCYSLFVFLTYTSSHCLGSLRVQVSVFSSRTVCICSYLTGVSCHVCLKPPALDSPSSTVTVVISLY